MTYAYPSISIVTPSYNQGQYLESTLRSVLDQAYPNLEYIVIDGGSTDASVDILRRYAGRLHHWVSEPDQGQMDALNKGFAHANGEVMAWLNSDDQLCPWTLRTVGRIFSQLPQVQWLTTRTELLMNSAGEVTAALRLRGAARAWFYRGWHLGNQPGFIGFIQQEATFWRRSLWQAAGGRVDASLHLAGDFELWARFFEHADLTTTEVPLAAFRVHERQKTSQMEKYYREAEGVLARYRDHAVPARPQPAALRWLGRFTGRRPTRTAARLSQVRYEPAHGRWQLSQHDAL